MANLSEQLETASKKVGIGQIVRHVFLCTGPNCCTNEEGMAAWEVLKKEIKDQGLGSGEQVCQRTKVGCLRICCEGPTMVVYPEGTWYHGMSADKIPQFVREHLVEDKPVKEWIFAENPIGG